MVLVAEKPVYLESGVRTGYPYPRIVAEPAEYDKELSQSKFSDILTLVKMTGNKLDLWQFNFLRGATKTRVTGKWAASSVGLCIQRQHGKNYMMAFRQLAGLVLWDESVQVMTAHEYKTAKGQFDDLVMLLESHEWLQSTVKKIHRDTGNEHIVCVNPKTGKENIIYFRARGANALRGLTVDTLYLDEAFALKEEFMGSAIPTLSARTVVANVQIWYTSSAGKIDSYPWIKVREQAISGKSTKLFYEEFSIDPAWKQEEGYLDNLELWYQANPAVGSRIDIDYVREEEREKMSDQEFARERLGIWDSEDEQRAIPKAQWDACLRDPVLVALNRPVLAIDIPPERTHATVSVCGVTVQGEVIVQVVKQEEGTGWLAKFVKDMLLGSTERVLVVAQSNSAVSAMDNEFIKHRVKVRYIQINQYSEACAEFLDKVREGEIVHHGQSELDLAVANAQFRYRNDTAFIWERRDVTQDLSPLVSVTLAHQWLRKRLRSGTKKKRRSSVG